MGRRRMWLAAACLLGLAATSQLAQATAGSSIAATKSERDGGEGGEGGVAAVESGAVTVEEGEDEETEVEIGLALLHPRNGSIVTLGKRVFIDMEPVGNFSVPRDGFGCIRVVDHTTWLCLHDLNAIVLTLGNAAPAFTLEVVLMRAVDAWTPEQAGAQLSAGAHRALAAVVAYNSSVFFAEAADTCAGAFGRRALTRVRHGGCSVVRQNCYGAAKFRFFMYPMAMAGTQQEAALYYALRDSPFATTEPDTACMFVWVMNAGIANSYAVSLSASGRSLKRLGAWGEAGENHLLFHFGDYDVPWDTGRAIIAKSSWGPPIRREFYNPRNPDAIPQMQQAREAYDLVAPMPFYRCNMGNYTHLHKFDADEVAGAIRKPQNRSRVLTFKGAVYRTYPEHPSALREVLRSFHNGGDVVIALTCWSPSVTCDPCEPPACTTPPSTVTVTHKDHPQCKEWTAEAEATDFHDLMLDSRFAAIVPGEGSHSYRLYEALQAGAIPVIFGTSALPLPHLIRWEEVAVIQRDTSPAAIVNLLHNLRSASPAAMDRMQALGRLVFDSNFRTLERQVHSVMADLSIMMAEQANASVHDAAESAMTAAIAAGTVAVNAATLRPEGFPPVLKVPPSPTPAPLVVVPPVVTAPAPQGGEQPAHTGETPHVSVSQSEGQLQLAEAASAVAAALNRFESLHKKAAERVAGAAASGVPVARYPPRDAGVAATAHYNDGVSGVAIAALSHDLLVALAGLRRHVGVTPMSTTNAEQVAIMLENAQYASSFLYSLAGHWRLAATAASMFVLTSVGVTANHDALLLRIRNTNYDSRRAITAPGNVYSCAAGVAGCSPARLHRVTELLQDADALVLSGYGQLARYLTAAPLAPVGTAGAAILPTAWPAGEAAAGGVAHPDALLPMVAVNEAQLGAVAGAVEAVLSPTLRVATWPASLRAPAGAPPWTPDVAIVSMCAYDAAVTRLGALSSDNLMRYCVRHNYTCYIDDTIMDPSRPAAWSKILLLLRILPLHDWVMWRDCDSFFMDGDIRIEDVLTAAGAARGHIAAATARVTAAAPGGGAAAFNVQGAAGMDFVVSEDGLMVNTGVFFLRNSRWAHEFLRRVYAGLEGGGSLVPLEDGAGARATCVAARGAMPACLPGGTPRVGASDVDAGEAAAVVEALVGSALPHTINRAWEQATVFKALAGLGDTATTPPGTATALLYTDAGRAQFVPQAWINSYPQAVADKFHDHRNRSMHTAYTRGDWIISFSGCGIMLGPAACESLFAQYAAAAIHL